LSATTCAPCASGRRFAASRRAESVVSSSRDCSSNTGIRADRSVTVPGDDLVVAGVSPPLLERAELDGVARGSASIRLPLAGSAAVATGVTADVPLDVLGVPMVGVPTVGAGAA